MDVSETTQRSPAALIRAIGALIFTALLMLPFYGGVVFSIEETNTEWHKASVSYGVNVPTNVEGGSPTFIVASAVLLAIVYLLGVRFAVKLLRQSNRPSFARYAIVVTLALAVAGVYLGWYLSTGPFWPPQDYVENL